jgi:hypothetical protein
MAALGGRVIVTSEGVIVVSGGIVKAEVRMESYDGGRTSVFESGSGMGREMETRIGLGDRRGSEIGACGNRVGAFFNFYQFRDKIPQFVMSG